ncbi:MAG TPA: substrate-binding domain-containing protein [Acidobacteriota bacterium]|nr:substrate-binding domain-containing protein [Acidobacteriota bacterium]
MRSEPSSLCWPVLLLSLLLLGACSSSQEADNSYTVAVIPKGTTHEFWRSIHAGTVKAARELGKEGISVTIQWNGPLREDDREQQIQVVEGFISQGVDGIVLAPLDDTALVRPVEEAARAGIPTVIIDSSLASDKIVSFVATDNRRGGQLAAQRVGELLDGKGNLILLRYQEGSASTRDREEGFLEELSARYPNIQVISSDQYAGPTRDTAKRAAENLLNRFSDQIDAVFCPNESSTAGMLLALQDIGKAGELIFVGFDVSAAFVEALKNQQLHGLVVQNPFKMGELGVRTLINHLQGEKVETRIDTGVTLVTHENLEEPSTRELLHPPLDEYLQ